jgi:hypothetical protein
MNRTYKLPIMGKALKGKPLKGDENDPICVIPFGDLPDRPTYPDEETQELREYGFSYTCLEYNLDEEWCEIELEASEEFHNWLAGILPELNDIKKSKGWKLDKTKMEKVKAI